MGGSFSLYGDEERDQWHMRRCIKLERSQEDSNAGMV